MARGEKKMKVVAFLKKTPEARNEDVAKACGCSVPMVSIVRRDLGMASTRGRKKTGQNVSRKAPRLAAPLGGDVLKHLAASLEYVDSADAMLELLSHVEAAGGVGAVRSAIEFHHRLSEAIG
jgi:predicted transcriptional regulator